jgi:Fe2+ transport system protein FeoA
MQLSHCRKGQTVRIVRVAAPPLLKQRLAELGFLRGSLLRIVRYAPLKDPLEVLIKGTHLSLRVEEAESVEVESPEPP